MYDGVCRGIIKLLYERKLDRVLFLLFELNVEL